MSISKIKAEDLPKFDVLDYLNTEMDILEYLDAVLEDGDPSLLAAAMKDIARARNTSSKNASPKSCD